MTRWVLFGRLIEMKPPVKPCFAFPYFESGCDDEGLSPECPEDIADVDDWPDEAWPEDEPDERPVGQCGEVA